MSRCMHFGSMMCIVLWGPRGEGECSCGSVSGQMPILGHRVEHGVDGGVCQVVSEARNLRDCHSYCFNGNERQFWSSDKSCPKFESDRHSGSRRSTDVRASLGLFEHSRPAR